MKISAFFNSGTKVWIHSQSNSSTIELSKKIKEKKIALNLNDNFEDKISLEVFILATVISYNKEDKLYLCEYDGEYKKDFIIEKANILLKVTDEMLYKADENFGYKDNSQLRNLNIANVLKNIQVCYELLKEYKCNYIKDINNKQNQLPKYPMYTFSGGILIAVNPYKSYDIYNDNIAQEYIGKNIINMEPHPFAIAEWTYRRMLKDNRSQSIIISGESGAGKTETSKHLLKYLSYVSNIQRKGLDIKNDNKLASIEDCLLSSNPLLEVFGNSMTIRNNNSSRFGKYMKLSFHNGKIINASINTYLLAKSRVVHLPKKERNYHIFYHILNEIIENNKWNFQDINKLKFNYLENVDSDGKKMNNNNFMKLDDIKEIIKNIPYNINTINNCFQSIGIDIEYRELIYDMIFSILLLGNIEYKKVENMEEEDCELTENSISIIEKIAKLWKINDDNNSDITTNELIELLTTKNIVKIKKKLSYSEAIYTRDSISRYLYEWIFNNIVELINIALKQNINNNYNINNHSNIDEQNSIGILDIFGFEDLEPNYINSFEQFLINYCNERLHSFFLEQLLYRDTILYKTEGIHNKISTTPSLNVVELLFQQSFVCTVMSGINPKYLNNDDDFIENKEIINDPFIDKLKYNHSLINLLPYNIISILDETGKIPIKGNRDHAFCNKVHSLNKLNNNFKNLRTSINRNSINNINYNNETNNLLFNNQLNDLSNAIENVIYIQKFNLEKTFTINHFAGPVKYTSNDFILKNTDFLSTNIENILLTKINCIKKINDLKFKLMSNFDNINYINIQDKDNQNELNNDENLLSNNIMKKNICLNDKFNEKNNLKLGITTLNQVSTPINTGKNKSVSTMFVRQVQNMLINDLYPTQSHFIRCIKPNNNQSSLFFDTEKVYKQLKIGGILQILDIMIHGYPCRIPYTYIYDYFRQLIEINEKDDLEDDLKNIIIKGKELLKDERLFVSLLLEYMGYKNQVDYQLGLTRVFFKFNILDKIEQFIYKCNEENSLFWKIDCINSLYNHWLKKRCSNYWNMLKCCFIIFLNYRYIRKKNASKIIIKNINRYILNKRRKELERLKKEEKERQELERIKKEEKERQELERIKKEEKERQELERIKKEEKERQELERLKKEEKERQELERIKKEEKEKEELERIKKEEKERQELERLKKEEKEEEKKHELKVFKNDIENKELNKLQINEKIEFQKKVLNKKITLKRKKDISYSNIDLTNKTNKRSRDDLIEYESDNLITNKKKVKSDQNKNSELINDISMEDIDDSNSINSPLLFTSAMRGKNKRYSLYYISGNDHEINKNNRIQEIKTLQDELVEAEFIDDIFNKNESNNIENVNLDNNVKTGIKRPTIFIPNTNNDSKDIIEVSDLNNEKNNIKKSLKDIQKNFRDNIIKQKKLL